MENLTRNLTIMGENLLSTSGVGIGNLLVYGEALANVFTEHQPFFNVSRGNTVIYIFLVILKNSLICFGISNKILQFTTTVLLAALTLYRLALFKGRFILELFNIWASWVAVLYFNSGAIQLQGIKRFMISIAALSVVPIFFPTYYLEFFIDVLCIINLMSYIFKSMCGPLVICLEYYILHIAISSVPLVLDFVLKAQGLIFDLFVISATAIPGFVFSFAQRGPLFFIILTISVAYATYEKLLYRMLLDEMTE